MVDIETILCEHEKGIKKLEGNIKLMSVKKEDASSMMDFIMEIKDEKVFDKSKFLKEIIDGLAGREYHYTVTSVTEPLQSAVRQKKVGLGGQKGKWQYVRR